LTQEILTAGTIPKKSFPGVVLRSKVTVVADQIILGAEEPQVGRTTQTFMVSLIFIVISPLHRAALRMRMRGGVLAEVSGMVRWRHVHKGSSSVGCCRRIVF